MKKLLFLLLCFPFLQCTYSTKHYQEHTSAETLHINSKIGEVVDSVEREEYDLFENVEGFVSATLYGLPNGGYETRIATTKRELKAVMADPSGIEMLRYYLDNFKEIQRNRKPFEKQWNIVAYDGLGQPIRKWEVEQVGTPGETYCGVGCCLVGLGIGGYVGYGVWQPEGDAYNVTTVCFVVPCGLTGAWLGSEIGKRFDKVKAIQAIKRARKPQGY